jgi:hypothetical protein
VQSALLNGLVDPRDQLAVLAFDRALVASGDRGFEAPEVRPDGALEEAILVVLAQRPGVPLSL